MHHSTAYPPVLLLRLMILAGVTLLLFCSLRGYDSLQLLYSSLDDTGLSEQLENFQRQLFDTRMALSHWLRSSLSHMSSQALLPALLVGDRQYLMPEHWRAFSHTGTSHLMAISGLHVGMVWGAVYLFLKRWFIFSAPVIALLVALIYSLLAGFTIPTQRAFLMLAVATWVVVSRRVVQPFDGFLLAMMIILLWDLEAAQSISFWLSFGAVGVLLAVSLGRLQGRSSFDEERSVRQLRESRWRLWIRAQLAITLGLAPLVGVSFDKVSWIAPLINLFAVPYVTLLLLPLLLFALLLHVVGIVFLQPIDLLVRLIITETVSLHAVWQTVIGWLLTAVSILTDGYWLVLNWVGKFPKIVVPFQGVANSYGFWLYCVLAYVSLFALLLPRPIPGRLPMLLGSVPLTLLSLRALING